MKNIRKKQEDQLNEENSGNVTRKIMMLCALMAGCGQSNQPAESPAASEAAAENNGASEEAASFKVGFIVSDASSGFWKEVLDSFEKACDEAGVEMTYQIVTDSAGMRSCV